MRFNGRRQTPGFDSQKFTQDDSSILKVFIIFHAFQVNTFGIWSSKKAYLVLRTAINCVVYCLKRTGFQPSSNAISQFGRIRQSYQICPVRLSRRGG